MNITEMLNKDMDKTNIKEVLNALKETKLLLPFNGNNLIELYTKENKYYIPLYTSETQIKNKEYTRLDKVTLDIVIKDIFSLGKYHAISINPDTSDFVMNKNMIEIYQTIERQSYEQI